MIFLLSVICDCCRGAFGRSASTHAMHDGRGPATPSDRTAPGKRRPLRYVTRPIVQSPCRLRKTVAPGSCAPLRAYRSACFANGFGIRRRSAMDTYPLRIFRWRVDAVKRIVRHRSGPMRDVGCCPTDRRRGAHSGSAPPPSAPPAAPPYSRMRPWCRAPGAASRCRT